MSYSKEDQLKGKKPKNLGKIKQVSNDAARRNHEYHLVLDEIDQEGNPWCESCGKHEFEHSHLIKRDFNNYVYMAVKVNIRRNCRECHLNWENAALYLLPREVGRIYLNVVKSLNEQYYLQKVSQFRKNLERYKEKNWLAISNGTIVIPKWVDEFFTTFDKL
jgi:hypothetical protein